MAVTLLCIEDQRHPLSLDQLTIRLPGDVLVRLPTARRMNDFWPANANIPDRLDPAIDRHVDGIARGDPSDVSKKTGWLGLSPCARRYES